MVAPRMATGMPDHVFLWLTRFEVTANSLYLYLRFQSFGTRESRSEIQT
jgi:hypothetical protein